MKYEYRGGWYTTNELSQMSGIPDHTLRDRLRRGFSVEESVKPIPIHNSVKEFCEASYWKDWIGMSNTYLYGIYWRWSVSNGHTPLFKQGFTRQLMSVYPMLKIVPTKVGESYKRIIRER